MNANYVPLYREIKHYSTELIQIKKWLLKFQYFYLNVQHMHIF